MQLTATSRTDNDLVAAWQAAHGAAWCHRLAATITHAACEENQLRSTHKFGDLRCLGCGGLENQAEPRPVRPVLAAVWDADEEHDEPETAAANNVGDTDRPGGGLDDEELEELLADLFPADDSDEDDDKQPAPINLDDQPEAKPRSVSVYVGRCARCGSGYMSNDLEKQFNVRDESVYRCHACGWRTSPAYENNRALFAAGGVIGWRR